ncbi:Retrovirus-related Pol polyprotein from transposon TNT 1-94 [Frankliniella fusca]|uniref:Retrovirus-related Pol polyprotein from transposon TNT 1-94 n=1 Tax=Frankliniella fusca TaxID=407009 RepID=A0AAE1GYH0_9NEOP|nr:Retrovirus-related Pol polyprotein from transposon TNT 1-94 [Frankliniella fusca]
MPAQGDNEDQQGAGGRAPERIVLGNGYNLADKDKLTGSDNFRSWEFLMKGLLYNEGLLEVIEGTEQSQDKLKRAYYRIAANVATQVHPLLYNIIDGLTAWNTLKLNYGSVSSSSKLELYQNLFSIKMENYKNVSEYVNAIMTTHERLVQLKKGLDDETVAYLMLIGLPSQYEPVKMTISSLKQDLTTEFVRERLLNCAINANNSPDAAFLAVKNSQPPGQIKKKVTCHFCKKLGHIQKDCRARLRALQQKKNGAPPPAKGPEKANHVLTPNPLVTAYPTEPKVLVAVDTEKKVEDENPTLRARIPDYAFAARSNRLAAFVDSGATRHMFNDRRFFNELEEINLDILVANDARVPCKGKGSVTINCTDGPVIITDVLYVPGLSANLVSVSVLTSKGFGVMFDDKICKIFKNDQIWLTAKRQDNLYVVNEPSQTVEEEVFERGCEEEFFEAEDGINDQSMEEIEFGPEERRYPLRNRRPKVDSIGDNLVVIAIYVDDILVLSSSLAEITSVKEFLSEKFELWDFGTVRSYLGVRVEEEKIIKVSHVPTAYQVADVMTKSLAGPRFKSLRENLGLTSLLKRKSKYQEVYTSNKRFYNKSKIGLQDKFNDQKREMPTVVCTCCAQLFFRKSTISESKLKLDSKFSLMNETLLTGGFVADSGIKMAPGEGNTPLSLTLDEDNDVLAFPTIYAGKPRLFKVKYSPVDIAKAEARHHDRRVAINIPKVMMNFCKARVHKLKSRVLYTFTA